jgi:type IV pilus biogenesis protein CpaD/CtpE
MKRVLVIAAGAAGLLGGCADGASNVGTAPPIAMTATQRGLTVPYSASRASNLRLRRSVDAIAEGNVQAVHARVFATSAAQARSLRQVLLGMGLDPTRITASIVPTRRASDPNLVLFRARAITTDCAAAISPSYPDDPTQSLLSLARCTQDNNLAAMVVDPADLVAPPPLNYGDGAYLINGVQAWRGKRQTPVPTTTSQTGNVSVPPTDAPVAPAPSPTPQTQ